MTVSPMMLPKVRSDYLRAACHHMPYCTLRIAGFVGLQCAPNNTLVGCHLPTIGKGVSTKVSDLFIAAGCATCHDILDGRNMAALSQIKDRYPAAFMERIMKANHETLSLWVGMGLIEVKDMEIV
jgi:hypothetical protein